MNERDTIIAKRQEIYDEVSRVLTGYEEGIINPQEMYEALCKVQNSWETVITAQTD